MKSLGLFILFTFLYISCKDNNSKESKEIIIEGWVKNIPDGKIYFAESTKWRTPLDSTSILDGHFIFTIKPTDTFVPFLADIHYWESTKVVRLNYRNHTLGNDSLKYSSDVFFVEPGYTKIEGDNKTPLSPRIFSGRENELLFKNQFLDFGWLENLDSSQRLSKVALVKKTIHENPFSYFLLESIYRSKEQYSKAELIDLFSLFNNSVQLSTAGIQFSKYFSIRPDDGMPLPALSFLNTGDSLQSIFDSSAKIHMLVFWASWCLPCRKEIPQLKLIDKKFANMGLKMVSISIDESKGSWQQAVDLYKMAWQQVRVPADKIEAVQQQFSFTTIPLIIFTDKTGKEISRFANYESDNVVKYEKIILKFID